MVMLPGEHDDPWNGAAPLNSDYLYISRETCRTNHDRVF